MPAITKRTVDATLPAARDAFLWDDRLKGFGLKVTPAGAKVYLCQYRTGGRGTATQRVTIGRHGAPWTPDQARNRAKAILGAVAEGRDPAAEKRAKRKPEPAPDNTFGALAEQFLAHGRTKRGRELRPATTREYRRALLIYAASLHAKPVIDIRRREIAELIETVATERGTTSAMRSRAALSRFFGWLMAKDKVEANPVSGTEGYETGKRKRVLSDHELRVIWRATEIPSDFNLIVRLCLWTGTRRGEPGGMADSELARVKTGGFDGEVWTVPGTRTKNHRDLALPLPRQALAALEAWPRIDAKDKLFGRVRQNKPDTGFQGWSQAKARLDDRIARLNERRLGRPLADDEHPEDVDALDWDLHDLRRTVETRMAGLGVRKEIVNRMLNHAAGPITETYDLYDYLPEKVAALQAWADKLETIVAPREGGNVVPITARA